MTIAENKTKFTPEELDRLPNDKDYELVNGELVERHMGSESSAIALKIGARLVVFVERSQLGHVFSNDCGYRCYSDDPDKVRKPDISFVAAGRLPNDRPPKGYIRIAPDLVVEVISPGDLASEIEEKLQEYLNAGVRLIWIVDPNTKSVRIHRPANSERGSVSRLVDSDTITGEDVLPGFECRIAEFFDI